MDGMTLDGKLVKGLPSRRRVRICKTEQKPAKGSVVFSM